MKHLVMLTMIALLGGTAVAAAADTKPGAVCKTDRQKFCKDAKKAGVKIHDCLVQHKDELSEGCKALIDKPKKVKGAKKQKKESGEAKPANGAEAPAGGTAAPAEGTAAPEGSTPPPATDTPAQGETQPQ